MDAFSVRLGRFRTLIYLSGVWLVGRGLAPIHDLARQAATLAPDSLDQSLNGSGQAEELQPLVTQFNALLARGWTTPTNSWMASMRTSHMSCEIP